MVYMDRLRSLTVMEAIEPSHPVQKPHGGFRTRPSERQAQKSHGKFSEKKILKTLELRGMTRRHG